MSKKTFVLGVFGLACAGMALGALATRALGARKAPPVQRQPLVAVVQSAESQAIDPYDPLYELPPDSTVFEPAPVSDRHVSARPHEYARRAPSADDYDSISADDLGSAFLARATDSSAPEADEYADLTEGEDLSGFQIVHPRG